MATPRKDPAALKPRGRKKQIPADARNRTIRCTEAEYAALMLRLREIRATISPVISSVSRKSG